MKVHRLCLLSTIAAAAVLTGGSRSTNYAVAFVLPPPSSHLSSSTTRSSSSLRVAASSSSSPSSSSPLFSSLASPAGTATDVANGAPADSAATAAPQQGPISAFLTRLEKLLPGKGNRQKLRENAFAVFAGLCLSFNSGFINGACLSGLLNPGSMSPGVPVAAVTGAYTQAGLALGSMKLDVFASHIKMILSFMGGSMISGFINPRPVPHRMSPRYGPSFLVGSVLLAASSFLAGVRPEGRAFLYLAALANGLQNAMSSAYSANLIRSTHMSGISSDIGMIFGQMLGGNMENAWRAFVLMGLASSFLLGGAASFVAVSKFRSLALVFNACFFAAIGLAVISFTAYQQHVSLWRAASGQWDWGDNEPPTGEKLYDLFEQYDVDGNGYLDEEEFTSMLKTAGMKGVTDVGFQAVFKRHGGKDGMSMDQFLDLVSCDEDGECEIDFDD